ncbi:hypothetical protein [Microbacterium sp. W4I20]|uniref:hypothetical protein n=1 Tax=Microbacterium sp. W4I20 TaxID=3042262 RepID=UPI0027827396|nr:hypothetical protein [Microbacterium sp. W4I20]MDQ0727365.1 ABC-2 type transport system permease protein [Microbacterium sp. W4I20]
MFRAELLGLVTTTATKVSALVAVVGLLLTQLTFVTLLPALGRGDIGPGAEALGPDFPVLDLTSAAAQLDTINPLGASMGSGSIGIALIAVVLLGTLAGTSDDRYGGMVGAALASPRRGRIVVGKGLATGLGGLVVGAAMAVVSLAALLITLAVSGTPFTAGIGDVVATLGRGVVAVAALALIGLAVGILVRTQLAGVITMLAILFVEPILAALTSLVSGGVSPVWAQFLPVALAQNIIHGGSADVNLGVALIALAALTAAALAAASVALSRRDL